MLLTLNLTRINELMHSVVVTTVHVEPGIALAPGAALFDLSVDLSAVAAHDCPPISLYRILLREPAWLRRVHVDCNQDVAVNALLAQFSTQAEEPLDSAVSRPLRVAVAGILGQSETW